MWEYTNTSELYHYGVPGMKWGHRKLAQHYTKKANTQFKAAKELKDRSKVLRAEGDHKNADFLRDVSKETGQLAKKYKAKAAKHEAAGKVAVKNMNKKKVKDVVKDKTIAIAKDMVTPQSMHEMAQKGYFGLLGMAIAKKHK